MASLVTAAATQAVDAAGQTVSRAVAGVASEVVQYATRVRVNANTALSIARRAEEMAMVVSSPNIEPTSVDYSGFKQALAAVQEALCNLSQRSYLSQLLHQQRDRVRLEALAETIGHEYRRLMACLRLQASRLAVDLSGQMEKMMAKHHAELQALGLDDFGVTPQTARLPPKPLLFFGRSSETQHAAQAVTQPSSGRVAILGGPGMGKTSLAVTVLYEPSVVRRYGPRRFFVPCDGSDGRADCLTTVSECLGIVSTDAKAAHLKLKAMLDADGPALLVLDNFESAWEAADQRDNAERLLQFFDAMDNLSFIVTMRGAERPGGVRWTRPFLNPMMPLADDAALQTFCAISDVAEADKTIRVLLGHLANIPLAIVLMASLAQTESLENILRRWDAFSTSTLVRGAGRHRLNSLDSSLALSLNSPTMRSFPTAQSLLSLLSLLPHGVLDTDVQLWGIDHSAPALSALIRSSLASRSAEHRIHVLAPIRSFMISHFPPTDADAAPVYGHFLELGSLSESDAPRVLRDSPAFYAPIVAELANVESVVRYALQHSPANSKRAISAVLRLCELHRLCGFGSARELLPLALNVSREPHFEVQCADLLYIRACMASDFSVTGDPRTLLEEAHAIYQRMHQTEGVVKTGIFLARYLSPADAVSQISQYLALATSLGDKRKEALCARELAIAYERAGKPAESLQLLNRAITIFATATGSPNPPDRIVGLCKFQIAELHRRSGDLSTAVRMCEEALAVFEEAQYVTGISIVHRKLGSILFYRGHLAGALRYSSQAAALRHTTDVTQYIQSILVHAKASAQMGRTEDAVADIEQAAKLVRDGNLTEATRSELLVTRGFLAHWLGDCGEARLLFNAARVLARRRDPVTPPEGMLVLEADCLANLCVVEAVDGNADEAQYLGICAVVIFRKITCMIEVLPRLVCVAEAVEYELAESLISAILLPLMRLGHAHGIARALLRSAEVAEKRNQRALACHRALNALRHFGEIQDERRITRARFLVATNST